MVRPDHRRAEQFARRNAVFWQALRRNRPRPIDHPNGRVASLYMHAGSAKATYLPDLPQQYSGYHRIFDRLSRQTIPNLQRCRCAAALQVTHSGWLSRCRPFGVALGGHGRGVLPRGVRLIFLNQPRRDDASRVTQGRERDPPLERGGKRNDLARSLRLPPRSRGGSLSLPWVTRDASSRRGWFRNMRRTPRGRTPLP